MKRLLSFCLTVLIMLGVFSCISFAADETIMSVEYYSDGSYGITSIKGEFTPFAAKGSTTKTKSYQHYNSDDTLAWKASITATFTYNGTTASCTDVSKSTTIYDSAWKCTASSCSKSGATATGNFTFKRYVLLVPVQTINKTLTLTCDRNGNVT